MKELDQLLAAWDDHLARVDENLLALEAEPTYQMLMGAGGHRAPLDGVTRTRVGPALEAMGDLFEHRARLSDVVERAKAIRASVAFWDKGEKETQIYALLRGPSIKLDLEPRPLAHRTLLDPSPSDVGIVPEALLGEMVRAYELARDAVLAVARAWTKLEPAIEQAERDTAELVRLAHVLGEPPATGADLARIEGDLRSLRGRVARDPLGAEGTIGEALAPEIRNLRARFDRLVRDRDALQMSMVRAHALQAELATAHVGALAALRAAPTEFEEPRLPSPVAEGLIGGLDEWRKKLEGVMQAQKWQAASVGLARWVEAAEGYLAEDKAVHAALEGLRQKKTELLGRLSAREAQARAFAEPALLLTLQGKARDARRLLELRPLSLDEATRKVEAFDRDVLGLVARARKGV